MYILGLICFHGDSAACIYKDGVLIAASEEERFRRIKHWAGLPTQAIAFCLKEAGITIEQVDYIASSNDPKANMGKKIWHVLKDGVSISTVLDRLNRRSNLKSLSDQLEEAFNAPKGSLKDKIQHVEHHRSHLASAFFASPFDEAAVLSIDGFGDFSSAMTGIGKGNDIKVFDAVNYPHSIGIFYTAFTQYLGFPYYGDEYKVMGLAPYGQPTLMDKVRDVIKPTADGLFKINEKYFLHPTKGVKMTWEDGSPEIDALYSDYMVEKFGKVRAKDEPLTQYHKDLACSVQRVCEEIIFHILNHLHKKTGCDNVCIAGGVAQNSVANGRMRLNTPFKNIYIPPAGHDAGTCIGAALWVYNQVLRKPRIEPMFNPYTGAKFSNDEIKALLTAQNIAFTELSNEALYEKVANCLIGGGIAGWFQGRAEFGPRALGHRSILADPRRNDVKEILNLKIKRRESFRPFAPSILKEFVPEYFEQTDNVPFMEKVFQIKPEKHAAIPAVTHVDGSGRLQSVDKDVEPKYHGLISHFHSKTGIPVLVNTSFNENEPIVNTPQEALDCFLRTKMDMLILENCVVER